MIGIVGGGMSGLVLAFELRRLGVDVIVWEAASVPGGVMRSQVHGDLVLEMGPQRARLSGPFRQLVESVGLTEDLVTAPRRSSSVRISPRPPAAGSPFILAGGDHGSSSVVGQGASSGRAVHHGPRADERVGPFLRRKFGGTAYQTLLGPLYGGLYASDPGPDARKARTPGDPGGAWRPEKYPVADVA